MIGRKNWKFSQSAPGVRASVNLHSLIETAKGHGLDPYRHLMKVFEEIPKAASVEDFEALLTDKFKGRDRAGLTKLLNTCQISSNLNQT